MCSVLDFTTLKSVHLSILKLPGIVREANKTNSKVKASMNQIHNNRIRVKTMGRRSDLTEPCAQNHRQRTWYHPHF